MSSKTRISNKHRSGEKIVSKDGHIKENIKILEIYKCSNRKNVQVLWYTHILSENVCKF